MDPFSLAEGAGVIPGQFFGPLSQVGHVDPFSLAEDAGVRANDVLLNVGSNPSRDYPSVEYLLAKFQTSIKKMKELKNINAQTPPEEYPKLQLLLEFVFLRGSRVAEFYQVTCATKDSIGIDYDESRGCLEIMSVREVYPDLWAFSVGASLRPRFELPKLEPGAEVWAANQGATQQI